MNPRKSIANLRVTQCLYDFIEYEALPDTGINSEYFWQSFSTLIDNLSGKNEALLAKREELQNRTCQYKYRIREIIYNL